MGLDPIGGGVKLKAKKIVYATVAKSIVAKSFVAKSPSLKKTYLCG